MTPSALPILGIVVYVAIFSVRQLADPDLPARQMLNDLERYFFPVTAFIHRSLLAGELPLWNPYQLAGVPFFALHAPGAAYPPLLLLSLLPPHVALVAHTVLHLLLAGIFTALFLGRLGVRPAGCLTAAIAFAGSSELVGAVHVASYLSTYAWLPASFWAAEGLLQRRSARRAAVLAGVMALSFLGGYAQGFAYTVQALGLYVLFRISTSLRGPDRARSLAALAAAGALTVGLVAVQLLPTLEHLSSAARGLGGMTFGQTVTFSVTASLAEVLTGRAPWPFGLPLLAAPLALAAVIAPPRRRDAAFFLCLLLLTFDFAKGTAGTVYPLYFRLPLGDVFRFPLRIGFVYQFCGAALLGLGCHAILTRMRSRVILAFATAALIVGFNARDVYVRSPLQLRFAPLSAPQELDGPGDVAEFGARVGYDRIFIEELAFVPRKLGTIHGIFVVPDYEPLLPARYLRFFGVPPDRIWHGWMSVSRPMTAAPRQDPKLLDLLGVRYYYGPPESRGLARVGTRLRRRKGPPMFVRREALPRAYVVHDVIRAGTEAEALERVRAGDFDPRRQAIVYADLGPVEPRTRRAREEVRIVSYGQTRVEIEATCASSCLLVLTDLFDPNWVATLDGERSDVAAVNYLFRGVRVPPGDHRITFEYRPRALYRGAAITLATIAIVVALLIRPARVATRLPRALGEAGVR